MTPPNTDLLRAMSPYDASGHPRPGQRHIRRYSRAPRSKVLATCVSFVALARKLLAFRLSPLLGDIGYDAD